MEKNKKRIFVEAHSLDSPYQGSATYLINIYRKILSYEKNMIFYFASNNQDTLREKFGDFSNVVFIKYKFRNRFIRNFLEIPYLIFKHKISVAHCTYILPFYKNKHCKYILTMHDVLFEDYPEFFPFIYTILRKFMFKISAQNADLIFTISNYSKERIINHYNISPHKIQITYCAVDEKISNFSFSKDNSKNIINNNYGVKKYILYVSRIEKRKQQYQLLDLYIKNKIYEKGVNLVFIGSSTLNTKFLRLFDYHKKQNLYNNIFWFKNINFEHLKHFYNGAEFFIYPSRAEGFGMPPLEASCINTPVLCANNTAMQEFSFYDYMFDASNREDFSSKLVDFLGRYKSLDTESVKEKINSKYSWAKSAKIVHSELF